MVLKTKELVLREKENMFWVYNSLPLREGLNQGAGCENALDGQEPAFPSVHSCICQSTNICQGSKNYLPFCSLAIPVASWVPVAGQKDNHVSCYSKKMLLSIYSSFLLISLGKHIFKEYIFRQYNFQSSKPKSKTFILNNVATKLGSHIDKTRLRTFSKYTIRAMARNK